MTDTVSATGAEALLDAVCRQVAKLSGSGPIPSRMRIQSGEVSVEMEWPAARATGIDLSLPTASVPVLGDGLPGAAARSQVCAPTVGTFYRAPEPGGAPFIQVGDTIQTGQQVGILEAMKLLNAIVADEAGTVVEILVEDGTQVEYGQPLIVVAPDGGSRDPS